MKWFTLQSLKKKKKSFFCVCFAKQLETSVFSATVNNDIPSLSLVNLHTSLVRHIFPSLTCTTTPPLCWNFDAFMRPGEEKKKKPHHPAEERMTVGCWRTARWLFKHIIFTSPSDFWSMAFSVLAEFILFHSLSVGFMNFGWNNGTTDC